MKTANWMMMFLLAAGLALAGCSKAEKPKTMVEGVAIDVPKLRELFAANTSADVQTSLSEVAMGLRYADYPRAFAALSKLDSAPGVTDAQKKAVAEMTEQVKLAAGKAASPAR
jgi:hypothetical protein